MAIKKNSILKKLLIPLLVIMVLQAGVIYGSILLSGAVNQIRDNAVGIMTEKVSNRKNTLESEMISRWSNMEESVSACNSMTANLLKRRGRSINALTFQSDLSNELLSSMSKNLLYLLRKNNVTGAFLILDGDDINKKSGMYFRDPDPLSNPNDFSDLLAERAPSSLKQGLGVALDLLWKPYLDFSSPDCDHSFYSNPINAAKQHPELDYTDLGYWSKPFYLNDDANQDGVPIITYTVPLIYTDGTPYGAIGIEVSVDFISGHLDSGELSGGRKDGYLLAVGSRKQQNDLKQDYVIAAQDGAYFKPILKIEDTVPLIKNSYENMFTLNVSEYSKDGNSIYSCVFPLQLYNTYAPFEEDQWALIGMVSCTELFSASSHLSNLLLISWIVSTLVGIFGIVITARIISLPISRLAVKVRKSNVDAVISLEHIHIAEIDELLDSIEYLSRQSVDSAHRLSIILEMAEISVGAFEYSTGAKRVFCTGELHNLLGLPPGEITEAYISSDAFARHMKTLESNIEEDTPDHSFSVYRLGDESDPRWVRLKCIDTPERTIGVVTDITQDVLDRKKLEHDRDYDLLSNLYNRRAFYARAATIFNRPETLRTAALIMMDLDNLKFVNDTYGHDYGDEYIRAAADALRKFSGRRGLVSRLSGDEFTLLLYGYTDKDEIRALCENLRNELRQSFVHLPDHTNVQVRASGGIAWYPHDATIYDDLVRYADFAMYMVKKSRKGEFREFDVQSYNDNAYLLHCREELNTLIEEELIDYQFQPIVDARTGKIFAFEALGRPQTKNIKTPLEMLSLASSQSKLAQIEHLTLFNSLKRFSQNPISQSECKLFVNSIANQLLDEADIAIFAHEYHGYLHRLVVEQTESEQFSEEFLAKKRAYLSQWNAQFALDDFGTGYNGESMLLDTAPDYLKIDMSIVREIHADLARQQILSNLISYSRERGIKLVAEGVETYEDLEYLVRSGVDYLQGYYLGRPSYTPTLSCGQAGEEIVQINAGSAR